MNPTLARISESVARYHQRLRSIGSPSTTMPTRRRPRTLIPGVLAVMAFGLSLGTTTVTHAAPSSSLRKMITQEAKRQGLEPALVHAVVRAESGYKHSTLSSRGAIGLMQLMPDTARGLGVNPWDPRQNVRGGVKFLGYLMRLYRGNTRLAVAAYNAGPGAVKRYGGIPPYRETRIYVNRVLAYRAAAR